ncbi:MAG: transglutaminase family protein [Rubrivivax sp.]|nr:transglutaminase family protein [Rubrivivax sp.]
MSAVSAADDRLPAAPATTGAPAWVALEVRHETLYRYASAVSLAQHQAHLQPLADAFQQVMAHAIGIDPAPAFRRDSRDAFGNAQTHFSVAQPHQQLRVQAASRLRLLARFDALQREAGPPWEAIAARLRYVAGAPFEPAVEFVPPSPYVPRLPELLAWARPSFAPGRAVAAVALDLMHRLHAEFRYDSASTQVDTPLAAALAARRGVCQDFAHILIGALRGAGLPARYVSGYLLTAPPDAPGGRVPLLGADASHAWVQAWCPGTPGVPADGPGAGWLDLDPTNDIVPASGHVRLAIGRDYGDVAPLRGVIRGGGRHELRVAVQVRALSPAEDDDRGDDLARSLHSA